MFVLVYLILFLFSFVANSQSSARIIQLSHGKVEGKLIKTSEGVHGNQAALVFLGVPYAKRPTGKLRFRNAVPPENWTNTLNCQNFQAACVGNPGRSEGNMSEDCLYLNVFTNNFCLLHRNCSVMVAIHGGLMMNHSPRLFDTESIVNYFVGNQRNVIVVTVAYRLGFFGFAHLNGIHGKSADSNVGIIDVLESIRFLNREVEHFGGDRTKITLFGHSSGAKVVSILSMSSLSDGLYGRQIMMSTCAISRSKYASTKGTRMVALRLGCIQDESMFDFEENTVAEIFDCLRNKTSEDIISEYLWIAENEPVEFGLPWVDGILITNQSGEVGSGSHERRSTMIGGAVNEVAYSLYTQHEDGSPKINVIRELCKVIAFERGYIRPLTMIDKCVAFYSNNREPSHIVDDLELVLPSLAIMEDVAGQGKDVFVYSFAYKMDPIKSLIDHHGVFPTHGDEQNYLMQNKKMKFDWRDYQIQFIMTGMISDFVNNGDPSKSLDLSWLPYTLENREYFEIDFDENFTMPGMINGYMEELNQFWKVTIPLFAGDHQTLTVYPPSFDAPQWLHFADAKLSLLFGEAQLKTLDCRRRVVEEVSAFVDQLYQDYRRKNDKGLLTIGVFSVLLIILMFCVSSIL